MSRLHGASRDVAFSAAVVFARIAQRRASALATLLAFPACWTAFEYLYGLAAPNGSYGSLAYRQMSAPLLIQPASLFGMYSITFLICLFANALAMALHKSLRSSRLLALGLGICALAVLFGWGRISRPQAGRVTVGAFVDASAMLTAYHSDSLDSAVSVSTAYASAIRQAADQGVQFAVTSEGGIQARREWQDSILALLLAVTQQTGVRIIAGVGEVMPPADLAFALRPNRAPPFTLNVTWCLSWKQSLHPGVPPVGWATDGRWRSVRTWISLARSWPMRSTAYV